MCNYYYKKTPHLHNKTIIRILGIFTCIVGIALLIYVSLPLISWQFFFSPIFASTTFTAPIPQATILNEQTVQSLIKNGARTLAGIDYTNAQNWFPGYIYNKKTHPMTPLYYLSIPTLDIKNALVSTTDNDLSQHLVHYEGTTLPGTKGNTVIFGHSTLPQLFNPSDYKTIFATVYKLKVSDELKVTINDITYTYKIFSFSVVEPSDTSIFTQQFDNEYVTLVTCTPPGTTWKRLIIKARLERI